MPGPALGELSSWQRVLVGLRAAFAGSPQIVVIDDLLDGLGGPAQQRKHPILLRSLLRSPSHSCGVLMSASDFESAMFADRVWSITGKRSLKLMAGGIRRARSSRFPTETGTRAGGSLGVGSP